MVFKNICILVLWTKVASALEGLRVPPEIAVWMYDTFDNIFGSETDFTEYLRESCQ